MQLKYLLVPEYWWDIGALFGTDPTPGEPYEWDNANNVGTNIINAVTDSLRLSVGIQFILVDQSITNIDWDNRRVTDTDTTTPSVSNKEISYSGTIEPLSLSVAVTVIASTGTGTSFFDSLVTANTLGVAWLSTTVPDPDGEVVRIIDGNSTRAPNGIRLDTIGINANYLDISNTGYVTLFVIPSPANGNFPNTIRFRLGSINTDVSTTGGPNFTADAIANLGLAIQLNSGEEYWWDISAFSDSTDPYEWSIDNTNETEITDTVFDLIFAASEIKIYLS